MRILFHRKFEKKFEKLERGNKNRFKERIKLFMDNQYSSILNNHPLAGKYKGYRSINVSGDLRAIFKTIKAGTFLFIDIDTHSKLYS